ncbi:tyrosine-type recombinase/integrase [Enterococcus sp. DIV1096b]|uniref:tyrosine-type recombinase/integrase n=1 Tax=Enterococcus sp. DIV1096b TaxID=2774709 RepID=UPI003D2A4120
MRISEVSALTIKKVNLSKKKLAITEGLITGGYSVENYKLNGTKTAASTRKIDLDERSIEIIQNRVRMNQRRKEEMANRKEGEAVRNYIRSDNGKPYKQKIPISKKFQETDYLFQTQNGTPVVYHSFNEFMNGHGNNSKPITSVRDILEQRYPDFDKHVTTHTYRYAHISLLAESGLPIKAVMERVGHSEAKTTLQIYNQVTKAAQEKVLNTITSWDFSGKTEK